MPFLVEEKEDHREDNEGDRKEGHEGIETDLFPIAHVEKNQNNWFASFQAFRLSRGEFGLSMGEIMEGIL